MNLTHRKRIIPVLLIHQGGLVKSKKFKDYTYIGDPINAVRIFNDKEVDEIVILDIEASKKGIPPNFETIAEITGEAFMPLAYGGGINSISQVEQLFYNGIEKVVLNSVLHTAKGINLITEIAKQFGSQSVIASIDIKKNIFNKFKVVSHANKKVMDETPLSLAQQFEAAGAGEIFLNDVDKDGMYTGYNLNLLENLAKSVSIPVIICGGARDNNDFILAEEKGASAMAAGSMFVFQRPHNAVLISYTIPLELNCSISSTEN